MKKICTSVLLMIVFVIPALAVSVCTKDSVVSVVLDPSIGGNSYTYNNSTGVWKTVFSYGNVSGVSTCSTVAPKGSMGSTKTSAGTSLDAVAGDVSGRYCWCKMTHPMSSLWAFATTAGLLRVALRAVRTPAGTTSGATPICAVACSVRLRLRMQHFDVCEGTRHKYA